MLGTFRIHAVVGTKRDLPETAQCPNNTVPTRVHMYELHFPKNCGILIKLPAGIP